MQNLAINQWLRSLLLLLLVCGLVGCTAESKRARYLKRAEAYFKEKEYIKAEIEFLNVVRLSKTIDPNIVARFAAIYYEQGRLAEAYPILTNAVALQPDNLDLRVKLATVQATFGQFKEAREAALGILAKRPDYHEALLLFTDVSMRPDEIVVARQKINELLAKSGPQWSAHVALAQLALRERQLDLAEKEIGLAAALNSQAPELNVVRSQLAARRQQPKEAEQFLRLAAEGSPARSSRRLLFAESKLQGTNVAEAKTFVEKVIKEAPDYVPAWVLRGKIALEEKDFAECSRVTAAVLAWNPGSYDINLLNARSLVLQQQTTNAVQAFERLLGMYDRVPELKYEAAVAYLQNEAVEEALKKLDDAIRIYPDYPEAVLLRAELKLRTGAAEEVVPTLLAFLKNRPDNAGAQRSLANAYRVLGRQNEALAIYRTLIRREPTVPEFWYYEGSILLEQRELDKARSSFEQALILAPAYMLAAERLLDLDLGRNDFDAAQRRVDEQMRRTTNSPGALMLKAKLCFAKRDWPGAESALTRVIKEQPDSAAPYSLLANVYYFSGDPNRALAQLRLAVDRHAKDWSALYLMGSIYESIKDYDKARKSYESALKLNPKMTAALNNLAYLLAEKLNQPDQALDYATQARALDPNNPQVGDTLGWILYHRREFARALPVLRESAVKAPEVAEIQYHLAMTHYAMGDAAAARTMFRTVLQLDKGFADTNGVPRRLGVLDLDVTSPTAVAVLEPAVKEDPNDFFAQLKLGQAYERTGANEKARSALEQAAKVLPTSPQPFLLLATLYADKLNHLPKALEAARMARKLAPNDSAIAGVVGRISYHGQDYPAALALLQEYARSAPADPEVQYDLALCYYAVGQFDEARTALGRYVTAARGAHVVDAKNLIALMDFSSSRGDAAQAESIASARVKLDPNDFPGLMTLGLIAQQNGKFSDAAAKYELLLSANKTFALAQRQLAILYAEKLGNDAKAAEYGSKARPAYPNDVQLAKVLGNVAYRQNDFRYAVQLLNEVAKDPAVDAQTLYILGLAQFKSSQLAEARLTLRRALTLQPDRGIL